MTIEQELKMNTFQSEQVKAHLNLMFTASWLSSKVTAVLKPFNLSQEQFNVLRILRGQQGKAICQKEILARMIERNSNLTLIVRKLIDKKLIEVVRSETDKREYRIKISAAGLELLLKLDAEMAKPENDLIQLNTSEAFHLNGLLEKLRAI